MIQMPNSELKRMTAQQQLALVGAVEKILRPMVRVLLTHGLTYTWLTGLLKPIFVEVAMRDFHVPGKAQTDSRITLLTGVHRKDVKRLREEHPSNGDKFQPMFL